MPKNKKSRAERKAEQERAAAEERKRLAAEQKKQGTKSSTPSSEKKKDWKTSSSAKCFCIDANKGGKAYFREILRPIQGRLPWPTDKGFISGHYGVHPHPVLKHLLLIIKVFIFKRQRVPMHVHRFHPEGEVTQRFRYRESNNAVIIKHGEYRTVYANLTSIYVNVGDKVSAKQSIGKIAWWW